MKDLNFAREVDELGRQGKEQEEIAGHFGMTLSQLRYKLQSAGYKLGAESRVRLSLTDERLEDVLAEKRAVTA